MRSASLVVIWLCWAAWAVLWFVMAFSTKRTVEHPDRTRTAVLAVVAVAVLIWLVDGHRSQATSLHHQLWADSALLDAVATALVVAGLAFTAWARLALGANWSGSVVFKEDHELVVSGPYALARHPIYTGLLAMLLGTAAAYAEPLGFVAFGAAAVTLYAKARREERLMVRHFPDAYPAYRRRVKSIIPHVL